MIETTFSQLDSFLGNVLKKFFHHLSIKSWFAGLYGNYCQSGFLDVSRAMPLSSSEETQFRSPTRNCLLLFISFATDMDIVIVPLYFIPTSKVFYDIRFF